MSNINSTNALPIPITPTPEERAKSVKRHDCCEHDGKFVAMFAKNGCVACEFDSLTAELQKKEAELREASNMWDNAIEFVRDGVPLSEGYIPVTVEERKLLAYATDIAAELQKLKAGFIYCVNTMEMDKAWYIEHAPDFREAFVIALQSLTESKPPNPRKEHHE